MAQSIHALRAEIDQNTQEIETWNANIAGFDKGNLDYPAFIVFANRCIAISRSRIAELEACILACQQKAVADRQRALTAAARANPAAVCHKCNGKGHIPGFEHIDHGKCFACGGTGVRANWCAA